MDFNVTLDQYEYVYDGTKHTPEATVKVGTVELVEGQDYEVIYENNKDAGTATVTIKGIENYLGIEKVVEYTIKAATLTLTPTTGQSKIYGEEEPKLTYTLTGNVDVDAVGEEGAITANTTKTTAVGEYPIVIGTYAIKDNGTFLVKNYNLVFTSDVMFAVTGKDISDTTTVTANVNGTEFEYTGSEITPGATITYNGETLEPGTDYEIRYEENIDAGEATVIITGKGNYSGSIELTFEITPKEVTVEWSNTELIFNNAMQLPTAEVDSGVSGETIVLTLTGAEKNVGPKSGDEYKAVAEIDKVEGGRAKKENYTLLNTETDFRIILDPNTEFDVTLSESEFEYDGTEHTPEETVKVGTIDLVEGQDYEVVYENNKDAGTGTITIVGIGNYEGVEKVIEITINKIDLTLTPKSGQNKVYRENEPELEYTLTGNVSGEEPGKEGAITANTTIDTPVGEYPIVIGTFAIKDNDKFLVKNYNLVFTNDVMFEVTGKDISDTSKVKVTLNPDTFVYDGTAKEPEATIEYNGETITISKTNTNENFEINYSNNVNVGTAIATIKGKGNYTGVINVEFEITPAVLDVVVNGHNAQYDNKYHTVEVVVNNVTDATIKYGTSEGTYDLDEAPTYIDVGSYPIYVEVTKPNYITYTGNAIVQIDKKTVNVVWSNTDLTFNHKSQKPSAEVLSGIDEETINYNILGEQTNVGTYEAELEITGVAGGRGKASNYDISPMKTTFTIKVDLTMEFDVTLEDDTFTYDGEEQTTDITVKVGEFELVEGRDYELIYENNTNANTEDTTPTVTVKGKGNYEGINKVIEFTIERAALIVTPDEGQTKVYGQEDPIFKYTFSGNQNGETPKFVGELSRESGDNVGLYEILQGTLNIEDDGDFKVSNYNLTLKTGVKFEITKADLSDGILTITPDVYEYNATERTPDTEVKLGDKILVRDQDYKVTYKDNIEVGTATVIIEGIGNYEGEITGEFEIEKVDISKATMTLDPNIFDYDGTEKRPNTTVVYKERTLILDVDYTVAYYNNIYAGYDSAYVIATGINSYEGELKGTFTILGKDLVGEIILEKDVYSYDKTEKRPIVTFVSEEGLVLEENVDFIVEYKDNIDAGTATVVVTGIGNYVGEMEKTFTIEKAYVNLMLKDKEVLYSGNEVTIDAVQIENVFDDLTDYITYKYYTDYELTIEMETLPKEIGVYYVEATLSGALNYFDRESNRARLVIYGEPNKPNIIGKVGETILQDNSSTNENVHIYIYGSSVENTSNDVEIGYKYSFDGITWLEYTEAIELTEEGTTTIYAKAYLKEDPTIESEIATYTITIDKTAPVVDDVIVPEKPDSVVIEIEVSGDDIEDVLITEDPTIDPTDPNSPFNPDNYTDPDVEKPSGDDWSKVDEDGKVIDELTQGDGEKVIYIWVKDKAGNVVGPIERKVTLSALKIGNNNDNKTTIMFKVTDKYLHTSNIQTENIALYVNDMLSQGKVTELIKEDIEGGYKYTAVIEDINGNGEMSIGLISGDVFDKAGNNLDISLKVATNEITVDNILPTMDVSTNDNKVYIVANDEHMKAVMVNGEIIGRTSGTYSSELRDGVNIVTVIDEYGNDVTQEIEYESTTITNKSIANEPELLDGMRAVYWENSVEREANDFIASMYNYSKLGTSEDNTTSEWANAKTEDGSYWVWIPRYAYKATYYTDETKSTVTTDKTIYRDLDVIFLKGKTNEYLDEFGAINPLPKEYVIPDAFRNDSANGGWTSELTGFWISKYEMSREDSTDNINWAATTIELGGGNTLTSNAGNVDNYIRVVSKPGVESWKGINVSTAFTNVLNMNLEANSHLIKNSEWEATLVLTESEYGRNGNYIDLDVEAMAGGLLTSTTTGNNTGVYDLVGGAWEYTSTYIEDSSLEQFASNLVNNTKVEYKEIITQSDTENISLTDVESNVFEETMLENAYNTSLVIFRGGYYNIATMDVESIPVGGSADSRVGFRAVLVCE